MPQLAIPVRGPADRLLLAGLSALDPILEELGDGVLLIGGLATAAWVETGAIGLPPRPTHDVDLGVDRRTLGLTARTRKLQPLLAQHDFRRLPGDEPFRFSRETEAGRFLLDLLLPRGASRHDPPLIEPGLDSLEAPGLAYAIERGPAHVDVTFVDGREHAAFRLPIVTRDAAFVMKAALAASGVRTRPDRRITDTTDAVMLAAACARDGASVEALRAHRRRSEVRRAVGWLASAFADERAAAPRRVQRYFDEQLQLPEGAAWAVRAAARLRSELA